jgi:hypothetical protein
MQDARAYTVPRVTNYYEDDLGRWAIKENVDSDQQAAAAEAFLAVANALFQTDYTANDLTIQYYADETEFRCDVWRFDSTDGVLSGALDAGTLDLLSADCIREPADAAHESIQNAGGTDQDDPYSALDPSEAADRFAAILGGTVSELTPRGGSSGRVVNGWSVEQCVEFALGDGRYCLMQVYGDTDLTTFAVGVYPDVDCANEDAFWRADLVWSEDTVAVKDPQDFRKGEPGPDDMSVEEAYEFYYTMAAAAGHFDEGGTGAQPKEPNATFYVDYSGARENYWHVEGDYATLDLTSQTKHMLNLESKPNGGLGYSMELMEIPYEEMGNQAYLDATKAFFTALFGEGSVVDIMDNAVYDGHYCTIDPIMADGTAYEIMYEDGLIVNATFFSSLEESGWGTDPNWAADWIYVNNETGETFHMDW